MKDSLDKGLGQNCVNVDRSKKTAFIEKDLILYTLDKKYS